MKFSQRAGSPALIFALQASVCLCERPGGKPLNRVSVGSFRIPFDDDRVIKALAEADWNETNILGTHATYMEDYDLGCLWDRVYDYYWSYIDVEDLPPRGEAASILTYYADECFPDAPEDRNYPATLLAMANDALDEVLAEPEWAYNYTKLYEEEYIDITDKYFDVVANLSYNTFYYIKGAYTGVGKSVSCSAVIDEVLDNLPEWEKQGSAAAITLMALTPTFLAFGNLYVPRSSEAFATSSLIGLGAAMYSLGLPVQSRNAIDKKKVVEIATFGIVALKEIEAIGSRNCKILLKHLQRWSQPGINAYTEHFASIRNEVWKWNKRWHCWQFPAILVAAIQAVMFAFAIANLFMQPGLPIFIFGCDRNWTGYYLSISAAINAFCRWAMWQISDHELVQLYALSDDSISSLEEMLDNVDITKIESTATHQPPLYPPVLNYIITTIKDTCHALARLFVKEKSTGGKRSRNLWQIVKDTVVDGCRYLYVIFKQPYKVLVSGFRSTGSAPRWRPVVVLMHLSTEGRPEIRTLFTGFIEAALLLILTFFFAAQWGGNLYITAWALALLLIFITAGRALALLYVRFSSKVWGLHVVNCSSQREIHGCLRIVCSMEGVLAVCNGAVYYGGVRLDGLPGYKAWRKRYDAGEFDQSFTPSYAEDGGLGDAVEELVSVDPGQIPAPPPCHDTDEGDVLLKRAVTVTHVELTSPDSVNGPEESNNAHA